jgi:hypothetical protein
MKRTISLDAAILRIEKHLLKKYPHLRFDVTKRSGREATIWFETTDDDDWGLVIERASGLATDILVDYDYWIHIQPRIVQGTSNELAVSR